MLQGKSSQDWILCFDFHVFGGKKGNKLFSSIQKSELIARKYYNIVSCVVKIVLIETEYLTL